MRQKFPIETHGRPDRHRRCHGIPTRGFGSLRQLALRSVLAFCQACIEAQGSCLGAAAELVSVDNLTSYASTTTVACFHARVLRREEDAAEVYLSWTRPRGVGLLGQLDRPASAAHRPFLARVSYCSQRLATLAAMSCRSMAYLVTSSLNRLWYAHYLTDYLVTYTAARQRNALSKAHHRTPANEREGEKRNRPGERALILLPDRRHIVHARQREAGGATAGGSAAVARRQLLITALDGI